MDESEPDLSPPVKALKRRVKLVSFSAALLGLCAATLNGTD